MKNILVQAKNSRGTTQRISTHNDNIVIEVYYQDSKKGIRRATISLFPDKYGDALEVHLAGSGEKSSSVVVGNPAQKLS